LQMVYTSIWSKLLGNKEGVTQTENSSNLRKNLGMRKTAQADEGLGKKRKEPEAGLIYLRAIIKKTS